MVSSRGLKDDVIWVGTTSKKILKFSSRTLVCVNKINFAKNLKISKKSNFKIFNWKKEKVVIFDSVSGSCFVYRGDKRILSVFEYLEWLKNVNIDSDSNFLKGLNFSTNGMSLMKYNVQLRRMTFDEILEDFFLSYKRILIKGDRIIQIRSHQSVPNVVVSHRKAILSEFFFGDFSRISNFSSENAIPKISDIKLLEYFDHDSILVVGDIKKLLFFKVNWSDLIYLGSLNMNRENTLSINAVRLDAEGGKIWVAFGKNILEFGLN